MLVPTPVHPARPGLWLPRRIDPTGMTGPTRGQTQRGRVRRTSHGFYLPAWVDGESVDQRIVEASVVVPPGFVITGWAALRWQGGRWFSGLHTNGQRRPVTILVGTHDIRPQPGIAVCAESCDPRLVRVIDGVRVHDPRAAVSFEMRYARDLRRAVTVLDMAAYSDLVSVEEVDRFLTPGQNSWTGVPLAREAVGFAEENSWSPQEVGMRMVWVLDAGLPAPLANRPVFDLRGRHLGTPDLLDPSAGVIGEYDGSAHLERERRNADVVREAVFRGVGLEPVFMTAADLRDPSAFVRRLREAYDRAASRRTSPRRWTVSAPPGWVPTVTVGQRRALTPLQRARLLAYRTA
jgi:hypothetical protein